MAKKDETTDFINKQLKSGKAPAQVVQTLVDNGWQQDQAQSAVSAAADVPPPPPAQGAPANNTAQTGNAGTPIQVENVQYNMAMQPVESRVGFFLKIASVGLWFTVFFVASTLAALIERVSNEDAEVAEILVFTIALSLATLPTFFIANSKMNAELEKNPATVDDLFFKKATRSGLYAGVVLTAIAIIASAYNLLASAFLDDGGSVTGFFQGLAFVAGFGGALFYFWQLHAKTKR